MYVGLVTGGTVRERESLEPELPCQVVNGAEWRGMSRGLSWQ
jgi:hypothetical protein